MSRYINSPFFSDLFHDPPTEPLLASTMVGFQKDHAEPEPVHVQWLQGDVRNLLNSTKDCWVNLIGHASRLGPDDYNFDLSWRRTQRVADLMLQTLSNKDTTIFHSKPTGSSESGSVKRDNSPQYRSVEVLIFAPDVPYFLDPSKTILEQRVDTRQTVLVKEVTHEPSEPGFNDGIYKLPWAIRNSWKQSSAENQRVSDHPLEKNDPDFGDETSRRLVWVDRRFTLLKVEIAVKMEILPVKSYIGSYTTSTRITRDYTYHYGVGLPGQWVVVTRKTTIISGKYDPPTVRSETFTAEQPSSYLNP